MDAISFRFSHYFVSFFSVATAVAAGFGSTKIFITEPYNIEFPRSLTEVVVSWSIPMHKWFKKCK